MREHASEPTSASAVSACTSPSAAPGRRGVDRPARARILTRPALPRYPGPFPGSVAGCASPVFSPVSVFFELCIRPSPSGVFMLQHVKGISLSNSIPLSPGNDDLLHPLPPLVYLPAVRGPSVEERGRPTLPDSSRRTRHALSEGSNFKNFCSH